MWWAGLHESVAWSPRSIRSASPPPEARLAQRDGAHRLVADAARVIDPDPLLLDSFGDLKRLGPRRVALAARLDDDLMLTLMRTDDVTALGTTVHR